MKGPVLVYSSTDMEVTSKDLAASIGVKSENTTSEQQEQQKQKQQQKFSTTSDRSMFYRTHENSSETRTESTFSTSLDKSGGCTTVSEELAKCAVFSVQSSATESKPSFTDSTKLKPTDYVGSIEDEVRPKEPSKGNEATQGTDGRDIKPKIEGSPIGECQKCGESSAEGPNTKEPLRELVKKRKLSESDFMSISNELNLKVSIFSV